MSPVWNQLLPRLRRWLRVLKIFTKEAMARIAAGSAHQQFALLVSRVVLEDSVFDVLGRATEAVRADVAGFAGWRQ